MNLSREDRTPLPPKPLPPAGVPETADLVFNVARLADCLGRVEGNGAHPQFMIVAYQAVSAALAAEQRMAEMANEMARLERMAMTDPLTGLLNRRGFEAELKRALAAARRYGETGALIYIDLDGFKPINDTHGHDAGDAVLVALADALQRHVRDCDRVARLGGDEFAVLLTRADRDAGLARAEALERMVNAIVLEWRGARIPVRASLGYQAFGADALPRDLLGGADRAMYQAKRLRADVGGRSVDPKARRA